MPWLVWAAKVRAARLDGKLRDARVVELGEQERSLEELLARNPQDVRASKRLEDVTTQRRILEMGEDRRRQDLCKIEEATPAV